MAALLPTTTQVYQVSRAVCRILGEAPLKMLAGEPSLARPYVAEALACAFPKAPVTWLMAWCGSRDAAGDAEAAARRMSGPDWCGALVEAGLLALAQNLPVRKRRKPSETIVRHTRPAPLPEPIVAYTRPPPRRLPPMAQIEALQRGPARRSDVAFDFGDPAPGRSAYDERQRRLQGAGGRP